jgi:hypothetical protein
MHTSRNVVMTALKTWLFVTLFALVLNADGFPVGTYTSCSAGAQTPLSGSTFLSSVVDGGALTLAQSGTTVTSTYVDHRGLTQSLRFSTKTDTLATIAQGGQVIPGFMRRCAMGPRRAAGSPASMAVTAGVLVYDAGMVFLSLTGDVPSDAGACGALSESGASFWIICENRQGGAVPAVDVGSAPVAKLLAGRHSCSTQVHTRYHISFDNLANFAKATGMVEKGINGLDFGGVGGASGTLTLTEDGARVTAQYSGDTALAGTLRFHAKTSTAAGAEAGQTLMAPCTVPGLPSRTADMLRIAAGSLTVIDSTLFLSFAGAMADDSSCPGAQVAGSVICSK